MAHSQIPTPARRQLTHLPLLPTLLPTLRPALSIRKQAANSPPRTTATLPRLRRARTALRRRLRHGVLLILLLRPRNILRPTLRPTRSTLRRASLPRTTMCRLRNRARMPLRRGLGLGVLPTLIHPPVPPPTLTTRKQAATSPPRTTTCLPLGRRARTPLKLHGALPSSHKINTQAHLMRLRLVKRAPRIAITVLLHPLSTRAAISISPLLLRLLLLAPSPSKTTRPRPPPTPTPNPLPPHQAAPSPLQPKSTIWTPTATRTPAHRALTISSSVPSLCSLRARNLRSRGRGTRTTRRLHRFRLQGELRRVVGMRT